jgi:hypothetical protein
MTTREGTGYSYPSYPFRALWPRSWWSIPAYTNPPHEWEIKLLESYREELECYKDEVSQEIYDVDTRMEELVKLIENGEEMASPVAGTSEWWPPHPFRSALSREGEISMLESLSSNLESQLEAVKNRLSELGGGNDH